LCLFLLLSLISKCSNLNLEGETYQKRLCNYQGADPEHSIAEKPQILYSTD